MENQKTLESFFAKEEEEEEEEVQRDSKVVKEYMKSYLNASQGLAFIDSSCLVKKTIGRVITLRKT